MKRLLVIRMGALGDMIHLSPAFGAVKAARPDIEIHCLTSPACLPLMSAFPTIDRLWALDKRAGWPGLLRVARDLRAAGIEGVVNLHPSLKTFALTALLGRVPVAVYRKQKLRVKGERQRAILRRHAAGDFYEPFRRLLNLPEPAPDALIPGLSAAAFSGASDPALASTVSAVPPEPDRHDAETAPSEPDRHDSETTAPVADHAFSEADGGPRVRRIGIIPGVGGKRGNRAWLPAHYSQLIRALLQAPENRILLIGGPDERELADGLMQEADWPRPMPNPEAAAPRPDDGRNPSPPNLAIRLENHCGRHDLAGTIALLSQCDLVIAGDTGPMHLAAALGVPLVGIYGPTSLARTGPLGLQPMRLLTPPEALACWPCELPACPLTQDAHLACMRDISVNQVLAACQEMLTQKPSA